MTQTELSPRIEQAPDMLIAGMGEHYDRGGDPRIASQWSQFIPYAERVSGRVGDEMYGVVDVTGDGFDYTAGVQVAPDANVAGLSKVSLPKRRYAVFTHRGNVSAIPQTMDRIWREWVPQSNERVAKAPFFERYDRRFDPKTGSGEVELWLPLES